MKVDMEYLENLSKLKIADSDKERFEKDFVSVLDFIDEITTLDLPEEDRSNAVPLCELRDDIPKQSDCDVLLNAPKKKDGCYLTPLVVE